MTSPTMPPGRANGTPPLTLPCREETMPHLNDTRDLASFAAVLAGELPGCWMSEYHRHTECRDQFSLAEDVWDMNLVSGAIAGHLLEHAVVLTGDDGTRLYVIAHPRCDEEFLVAAMAPPGFQAEAFRGVREPDGIAVSDDPFRAAEDIVVDLLPRYEMAIAEVQHNSASPGPPPVTPACAPEHTVTWCGDSLLTAQPENQEVAKALHQGGFAWDLAG
ncbi:MAG: hypothetical protein JO362_17650 [Streptomycetaceae bacterium]|nr:hypothetical protein [Streptomycetaceae bacterium]